MRITANPRVDDLKAAIRYEALREILRKEDYAHHLDKQLAYWALPTDRRLPLAFLGRRLGELLNTPFAELASTPGIGTKKLDTFVKLLARAANTDPSDLPVDPAQLEMGNEALWSAAESEPHIDFDATAISEVNWGNWRSTVLKHGLGNEKLGRFAPSLRGMTRVIWNSTLESYAALSLNDIRNKRTHGDKRVRAILAVFHGLHEVLSRIGEVPHLAVRVGPRRITSVEEWVGYWLQTPGVPNTKEIQDRFITPLVEQVRVDAPQQIVNLVENRLGVSGPITSVRQAARTMGLTRARVYQLLNEVNDIMIVRWPSGRRQLYDLKEKVQQEAAQLSSPPSLARMLAAIELFYPSTRRGAAGPLDRPFDPAESEPKRKSRKRGKNDDAETPRAAAVAGH